MPHGLIHGVKRPVIHGVKHNMASMFGVAWTIDATSGKAFPASSTEWAAFIAANGLSVAVPSSLWLNQEASGNLTDSIGSITLTAAGTVSYQQAVSGYSRLGVGTADNVNSTFGSASASLPSGGVGSQTILDFALVSSAPGGNRALVNGQAGSTVRINSTPRTVAISGANASTGTSNPIGSVHPYVYRENATSLTSTVMTDQEKLTPTHGTILGRNLSLGAGASACAAVHIYTCAWYNTDAEISDANMKALLQALGWTISW